MFILGDMLVFAILFATYLHYRGESPELFNASQYALKAGFGAANTVLLLLSSLLVATAIRAIRIDAKRLAARLIVGAIACGLAFSTIKVLEYYGKVTEGITPATNEFFMYYFVLTGIHWFHLIIGLVVLGVLVALSKKSDTTVRHLAFIECGACFWHMVDLIWIVLFPLLYLVR